MCLFHARIDVAVAAQLGMSNSALAATSGGDDDVDRSTTTSYKPTLCRETNDAARTLCRIFPGEIFPETNDPPPITIRTYIYIYNINKGVGGGRL